MHPDDLRKFAHGDIHLDFRRLEDLQLSKVESVYLAIFGELKTWPTHVRIAVDPQYQLVYGDHDDDQSGSTVLERVMYEGYLAGPYDDATSTSHKLDVIAKHHAGVYQVYRRGESGSDSVVRSVLEIGRSEGDRRLYFRAAYRSERGPGTRTIEGLVLPSASHLWFLGYDASSRAPYIYASLLRDDDETIDLPGIMLRYTEDRAMIAARLQARPFDVTWEEALATAGFLKLRDAPGDLHERMDNEIDNKDAFVLTIFKTSKSRGADPA